MRDISDQEMFVTLSVLLQITVQINTDVFTGQSGEEFVAVSSEVEAVNFHQSGTDYKFFKRENVYRKLTQS